MAPQRWLTQPVSSSVATNTHVYTLFIDNGQKNPKLQGRIQRGPRESGPYVFTGAIHIYVQIECWLVKPRLLKHAWLFKLRQFICITKVSKILFLSLRGFFQAQNAPKPVFGQGPVLDPAGGAYDCPQTPELAAFSSRRVSFRLSMPSVSRSPAFTVL